jgi:hypothetical protein
VERHHLDKESQIEALKEAAKEVMEMGGGGEHGVEITKRVEAAINSYNNVCANLLGKQ